MKKIVSYALLVICTFSAMAPAGCGSNPNVEGAKLDLRNKDYNRALENIAIALSEEPENAEALSVKGQILQGMAADTEDARERAVLLSEMALAYVNSTRVDSTFKGDHDRRMRMAYVEEFNAGIEVYDRAQYLESRDQADGFEMAAAHFRNATMIYPDSTDAYFNEASAFFNAARLDDAIETFRLALDRGNTDRQMFVYLVSTLERAAVATDDEAVKQLRYREMVDVLERALVAFPTDEELRTMMMNAFVLAEEEERARSYYEEEFARQRTNKTFLYNYGTLLLRQQDYDVAIAILASAVELDPDYTNAQYNLGAAYINKAVVISEEYRARDEELFEARSRLSAEEAARRESALKELDAGRTALFRQAIKHLQVAKALTESELGQTRDICRALYQAFGQTNQRQRAEEVVACADLVSM